MTARSFAARLPRLDGIRVDSVLGVLALLFLALLVLAPAQAAASAVFTLESLVGVSPFLIASVAVAAYAKASGADNLIARAFSGHVGVMILFAALMGALSPFCSCGVIPLIAALLSMGVPVAAVMAFWLASPLMDPSMFVLTSGVLGLGFAVSKTLAAVAIGLLGGFVLLALQSTGLFERPLRDGVGDGGCGGSKMRDPGLVVWRFWGAAERRQAFTRDAARNGFFLGKWLALAFLLESLMLAWIPAEAVAGAVGGGGWLTVVGATLVGVPAYLNGYAALPLVSGLVDQGMAPGAAMAFLLAGGVTSIPAAMAVFALARLPVCIAYVGFALLGSLAAGLAYGLIA
jgi:uncharacterized membrane protein YraQ (UPF0718 family)